MANHNVRKIAIIGGGCTAAFVLANLERTRAVLDVTVVEPRERIGRGMAYSTTDPSHLLNVRTSNLGAFPDAPDHFAGWVRLQGASPVMQPFQPRMRYGAYLTALAERAMERLRDHGGTATHVRRRAVAVRSKGQLEVQLDDGATIHADHVVLALGPPPSTLPASAPHIEGALTFDDPWADEVVDGARTLILVGAGLTAVDVALSACARNPHAHVIACSRSGTIPRAHLVESSVPAGNVDLSAFEVADATADSLADAFMASIERARAAGQGWRDVVDALRERSVGRLWSALSTQERRRWLERYGRAWDVRRHRMAPSVAARLQQLQQDGRLRFVTRSMLSELSAELPAGESTHIVNCTGFCASIHDHPDQLVHALLQDGIVQPEPLRMGLLADASGRVVPRDLGAEGASIYVLGALRRGDLFETTAVPELRAQAAAIAAVIAGPREDQASPLTFV